MWKPQVVDENRLEILVKPVRNNTFIHWFKAKVLACIFTRYGFPAIILLLCLIYTGLIYTNISCTHMYIYSACTCWRHLASQWWPGQTRPSPWGGHRQTYCTPHQQSQHWSRYIACDVSARAGKDKSTSEQKESMNEQEWEHNAIIIIMY